jgi:hypothetical protein
MSIEKSSKPETIKCLEESLESAEKKVFEELVKNSQKDDYALFEGVYSKEEIATDQKKVIEIKKKFTLKQTSRSKLLEALAAKHIKISKWLGNDCEVIRTLDFDDYSNHTDLVAEIDDGGEEPLRIAIDLTTTCESDELKKKYTQIRQELSGGRGTFIKYFQSKKTDLKGTIKDIPSIVLAINNSGVTKLSKLEVRFDPVYKSDNEGYMQEFSKNALQESPAVLRTMEQIVLILDRQKDYLEELNERDISGEKKLLETAIYNNICRALNYFERIYIKKSNEEHKIKNPKQLLDYDWGLEDTSAACSSVFEEKLHSAL